MWFLKKSCAIVRLFTVELCSLGAQTDLAKTAAGFYARTSLVSSGVPVQLGALTPAWHGGCCTVNITLLLAEMCSISTSVLQTYSSYE